MTDFLGKLLLDKWKSYSGEVEIVCFKTYHCSQVNFKLFSHDFNYPRCCSVLNFNFPDFFSCLFLKASKNAEHLFIKLVKFIYFYLYSKKKNVEKERKNRVAAAAGAVAVAAAHERNVEG